MVTIFCLPSQLVVLRHIIGRRCVYALSKDSENFGAIKEKYLTVMTLSIAKGNKNMHCYATCDGLVLSNGDILAVASLQS